MTISVTEAAAGHVQRQLDARARDHQNAREDLDSAHERVQELEAQAKQAKAAEHEAQRSLKRYQDRAPA